MSEPIVRRLRVDLGSPIARHWCAGDPFRTALFDALSMSFPAGEQFFIDSVKRGAKALPDDVREPFEKELQGFIGQEATHRYLHAQFNAQRLRAGRVNHWEARILRRRKSIEHRDATFWLGATAASEHFTAILAEYLLARPWVFENTEDRLRDFWLWHASEEVEHRSTAHTLYKMNRGGEWRRRYLFIAVTLHFLTDAFRQTINNLWHDGTLFSWRTWREGLRFAFGRDGMVPRSFGLWRRYFRSDFHPDQADGTRGAAWLASHASIAVPVATNG
jgi:predicted metal-dependent hydrolase